LPAEAPVVASACSEASDEPTPATGRADLMRRAFDIDVLACPRCGAIRAILAALAGRANWWSERGLSPRRPTPARAPAISA